MSFEITVAFVEQYRSNILLLSQQKVSRTRMTCQEESVVGRTFYGERIGATAGEDITDRHGDTPQISTPHSRRRGSMVDWDIGDLVDEMDKIKMLIDPTSTYIQNFMAAANRRIDKHIYDALGGTAAAGVTGGTTVNNYDAGECRLVDSDGTVVSAGSNHSAATSTVLTIAKLLTCKTLLDEGDIDPERQRYFVTNPFNLNELLNTTEVKSSDYNTVKALAQGKIDTFMGFKFIMLQNFQDEIKGHLRDSEVETADEAVECYAWAQDAIKLGVGKDITTEVDRIPLKRYSVQVYMRHSFGAVRVEGPAVVEISLKKK
ncbi:hypothetical protein LCGC14_0376860 [marine sediment metagenome]|uniref:Bacteriophage Mu GpT domain-containing protein n=1 Tax=marine sediment metagenome TaxID=412755 RepID=A0A0F9T3K4_9ZZZZ